MEKIIKELLLAMNNKIEEIDASNNFHQAYQSLKIVQETRKALELELRQYTFSNQEEQIYYFKYLHPQIYRLLYFHFELYRLEDNMPIGSEKNKIKYLEGFLEGYQNYIYQHKELYNYYRLQQTHLDATYFTRQTNDTELASKDLTADDTDCFSVISIYANITARLQAIGELDKFIQTRIENIISDNTTNRNKKGSTPTWTLKKSELIEVIYALHNMGAFNHGNATLKSIVELFQVTFNITLSNYNTVFHNNIRLRKGENRTHFIDKMAKRLEEKMTKIDQNPKPHPTNGPKGSSI